VRNGGAPLKLPERERRSVAVSVIRIKKYAMVPMQGQVESKDKTLKLVREELHKLN
jgi:hypothetical protein